MKILFFRALIAALTLPTLTALPFSADSLAQTSAAAGVEDGGELQARFQQFLDVYRPKIKQRDRSYLQSLHPKLPEEMYDFFFDVTLNMMRHSETEGVEPSIECQDFDICKAIYPQPNDSWAAQRFILDEGKWQWLDQ